MACKVCRAKQYCASFLCLAKQCWEVFCASFVVQRSAGKCFVQALQYKVVLGSAFYKLSSTKQYWYFLRKLCNTRQYWQVPCASFIVQSNIGKCFVEALQNKVVLGSTWGKFYRTKQYWEVLCGSFVIREVLRASFVV